MFKSLAQRLRQGFSDSETWSLDHTIAAFALPRMKRFREINIGLFFGMTEEETDAILDKIIRSLELCVKQSDDILSDEDHATMIEGLELFGKHFHELWW